MRQRVPERGRWLSAVLILFGIVAATAFVELWPRSARPVYKTAPLLASRALPLFAAPLLSAPSPLVLPIEVPLPIDATEVAIAPSVLSAPATVARSEPEAIVDAASDVPAPAHSPLPVLSARHLEVPFALPAVRLASAGSAGIGSACAPGSAGARDNCGPGLVELPAVAMTRVVTVAGRGIMTGLRVTSAMFKAAF